MPTATTVVFLCVAALAVITFFTMQGPKRKEIPYNDFFWKNFSLPPETNYFKNNKSELESIYKVSLETQFKFSN